MDALSEYFEDRRFATLHLVSFYTDYKPSQNPNKDLALAVEAECKEKLGVATPKIGLRNDFRTIVEVQGNVQPWERVVAGRRFRAALAVYRWHHNRALTTPKIMKWYFKNSRCDVGEQAALREVVVGSHDGESEVGGELEMAKLRLKALLALHGKLSYDRCLYQGNLMKWCEIVIAVGGDTSLECDFPERLPLLREMKPKEESAAENEEDEEKKDELVEDGVHIPGLIRAVEILKDCLFRTSEMLDDIKAVARKLPLEEQGPALLMYEAYEEAYQEVVDLHCWVYKSEKYRTILFRALTPSLRASLEEIHQFDGDVKQLTLPGTKFFLDILQKYCLEHDKREYGVHLYVDIYPQLGLAKYLCWSLEQ